MSQARKILIADPDVDSVRVLTKALRQRGFQVHYAPDGSRALEVAVLRHPDLTLFDEQCRLIDARTFVQILRTNPRTADIPVVLTTANYDADKARAMRDGYLKKPFNLDEVLGRIDHLMRRNEAAKDLKGEQQEIEGSLGQLGIPDLLQLLAMNKRTGKLSLTRGSESGEIFIMEGRPAQARAGRAEGEKALFRLLAWNDGSFHFAPGSPPAGRPRIQRAMDDALLEGMRQADEIARLTPQLPPRHVKLHLAPDAALPKDQHPVTAQVVELMRQPRAFSEIVDLAPATDLEVLTVVGTLLQKGVAKISELEGEEEGRGPLLGPAEVHALRGKVLRGRPAVGVAVAKVFLCGGGPGGVRRLLRELPGLRPVEASPPAIKSGFGTVGTLEVSEVLRLDFCVLPHAEAARPLWRPFSGGCVGALLLDTGEATQPLARYLAWDLRVPLVSLGAAVPDALRHAPAGAIAASNELSSALQNLLALALNPPEPTSPTAAANVA